MQVSRDKSIIKVYKTLSLRVKQLKSGSQIGKQKQVNYKSIKNTTNKNKHTKK